MIDIPGRAQAEIAKRLERYDKLSEFLIRREATVSANGYDVSNTSPENEWYSQGATDVLDDIRALLGWPEGDDE